MCNSLWLWNVWIPHLAYIVFKHSCQLWASLSKNTFAIQAPWSSTVVPAELPCHKLTGRCSHLPRGLTAGSVVLPLLFELSSSHKNRNPLVKQEKPRPALVNTHIHNGELLNEGNYCIAFLCLHKNNLNLEKWLQFLESDECFWALRSKFCW